MTFPLADPAYFAKAALRALDAGDNAAGLALTGAGLVQFPSDARLWQIQALLYRQAEDLAAAMGSFERADALAPRDPLIVHGHARVRLEAGFPAIDHFARARQLAPTDDTVVTGLVGALLAQGQFATAIAGLERMLAGRPEWLEGHALLAQLRWQAGDRNGFARSFEDALKPGASRPDTWNSYIVTLIHAGQYAEALSVIARARVAAGGSLLLDWAEASCLSELGELARADRLFDQLSTTNDIQTQLRRVRHLLKSGRSDDAAVEAARWIETDSANQFWPYLSLAWRLLGDPRWLWLLGDTRMVGVYDIADRLPDLGQLADTLRALHTMPGQPLIQSVRGGTQTEGDLLNRVDPLIQHLRSVLRKTVAEHAAQLPHDPAHPFLSAPRGPIRFAASWSVRLNESGHHSNHVHPMGWLSSALYVSLPTAIGRDGSNPAGWLTLGVPPAELALDLPPFRTIEPKPGRLVLFPSIMWHGTVPFAGSERLTVAFDVARPR